MSTEKKDKILFPLKGKPSIVYSWRAFIDSGAIDRLVTVFRDDCQRGKLESAFAQWIGHAHGIEMKWTRGGKERQDSVLTGLEAVAAPPPEVVFIHDCARPLVQPGILRELHALAREDGAACLGRPMTDTVKELPVATAEFRNLTLRTLDRDRLWTSETPQAFRFPLILDAYRYVHRSGVTVTDDAAAVSASGHTVSLLKNPVPNPKLTISEDIPLIESLLTAACDQV